MVRQTAFVLVVLVAGLTPDSALAAPALDGAASALMVLDEARDWPRTSDHVPVIADFVIE